MANAEDTGEIGLTNPAGHQMKRVLVMTGDGKGKTSAGFGMLLRARGNGYRCVVVQFMKASRSGELELLETLGVNLIRGGLGCISPAESSDIAAHQEAAEHTLGNALKLLADSTPAFWLFDEACTAASRKLVPTDGLLALIDRAPPGSILVFTGRDASAELVERADTVTIMRSEKHPFTRGLKSQRGVEF